MPVYCNAYISVYVLVVILLCFVFMNKAQLLKKISDNNF